jgi:hypothetical protein
MTADSNDSGRIGNQLTAGFRYIDPGDFCVALARALVAGHIHDPVQLPAGHCNVTCSSISLPMA